MAKKQGPEGFAKRQRERMKQRKRMEKLARRQERKESGEPPSDLPDDPAAIDPAFLGLDGEPEEPQN